MHLLKNYSSFKLLLSKSKWKKEIKIIVINYVMLQIAINSSTNKIKELELIIIIICC